MDTLGSAINHLQAFSVTTAAFAGIVAYDTVYCLIDEIAYIYMEEVRELIRHGKAPSLPNLLMLNARLLAFPMVALQLAILAPSASQRTKTGSFQALSYLGILALANAIAIFVIRVIAIRSSRLPMKVFLWSVSVSIVAIYTYNIVASNFLDTLWTILPTTIDAEREEEMYVLWRNWTITVTLVAAFDTIVFGLTLATRFSGGQFIKTQSKIGERFYFDSLQGFAITCSVSIIDLLWIARNRSNGILMAVIVPVQIFLALTIAPRVLRSLKLQAAKEKAASMRSRTLGNSELNIKSTNLSPEPTPASKIILLPRIEAEGVTIHRSSVVDIGLPA